MELYKRIKKRREELGLSQEELAHRMGYKSRSSINKIELGLNDIPQSKIVEFAKALDISPAALMGFDDTSKMYQDETFENYLNKIGIPCEYVSLINPILSERPHHEKYYSITLFGKEYHLPIEKYNSMNINVISLVIEYATSGEPYYIDEFLKKFFSLSDIGKKRILDNINDLAQIYISDNTIVNAAHEIANASDEDNQFDENIMDDDNF